MSKKVSYRVESFNDATKTWYALSLIGRLSDARDDRAWFRCNRGLPASKVRIIKITTIEKEVK